MYFLSANKSEFLRITKKYLKVALRFTLVFILWLIREIIIVSELTGRGLVWLKKYIVKYSIQFWHWLQWASPIAWRWLKWAMSKSRHYSYIAWLWTVKISIYLWCWIKVLTNKMVRMMFVTFWRTERWVTAKHEEYVEFKRTKGVKGLVKDARRGVKTAVNRYMDEEQVASTEVVLSDDELIDEELGQDRSIQIGKKLDKFVKKIVNEK